MGVESKFVIVVTSYNDEEWIDYCFASILNQTYSNYRVLFYDDASSDGTYKKAMSIAGNNPRFSIHTRSENKSAIYSWKECLKEINDEEIFVGLSGDDWLFDVNVLENLNNFYNKTDVWMTYGKFYCCDGKSDNATAGFQQGTHHSDIVHDYKLY